MSAGRRRTKLVFVRLRQQTSPRNSHSLARQPYFAVAPASIGIIGAVLSEVLLRHRGKPNLTGISVKWTF